MNAVLMRLEGPLQSWGVDGRFYRRPTNLMPTKSGVAGLVCACIGLNRSLADEFLPTMRAIEFGVRVDRPGKIIQDYQVAGAGNGFLQANGKVSKVNKEVIKDYLADASFLAVWRGPDNITQLIAKALKRPKYMPFLGRKSCQPSCPIFEGLVDSPSLRSTLESVPLKVRRGYDPPASVQCVYDCSHGSQVVNDVPVSFEHRHHRGRTVAAFATTPPVEEVIKAKRIKRKTNRNTVSARYEMDEDLCVVCSSPATECHHITYRNKGRESITEMRSLCAPCHLTVSYHEQMMGMGRTRIDPLDPLWFDLIRSQRQAMR